MTHVAVDIGASGGTVYLGEVSRSSFAVEEVDRFDNGPVERDGRYVWDVNALVEAVVAGVEAAAERADPDTVGIDTWGVDFGFLSDGDLLRDPTSYRDPGATAASDDLFETVDRRRIFEATGITHWNVSNTLLQLHTVAEREPAVLDRADRLLMMPQLLSTLLGGRATGELTVASTTQMVDPADRTWARDLLAEAGVPTDVLPALREPGERLGALDPGAARTAGRPGVTADLDPRPELVTPASHDTASAVAALPLADDAAFLSTGTWFILGVERDDPLLTDAAFEQSLSNELGVDGTVRLLKNVDGFFLLEQCREAWRAAGDPVDYGTLLAEAREATPRASLVDPDATDFAADASMPEQVRSYCRRTDQPVPSDRGAVVRCLLDSLAAKTAVELDRLAGVVDGPIDRVNLGGGGVRNDLFCQLLADATGRPVTAGPVEATAVGNLLTQAVAFDTLPDLAVGRDLVSSTFDLDTYAPVDPAAWEGARERIRRLSAE